MCNNRNQIILVGIEYLIILNYNISLKDYLQIMYYLIMNLMIIFIYFIKYIIQILSLEYNNINDQGVQYLSDMLKINIVIFVHIFILIIFIYFLIRHLLHLIFNTIKLERKDHNIWLMD